MMVLQQISDGRGSAFAAWMAASIAAASWPSTCGTTCQPYASNRFGVSSVNQPSHITVDRDAVVVVEADELAELERAGKRADFVRYAFHQATVAEEHVGVVVDDLVSGPVERSRQQLFRQRHADGIGNTLAEGAGRRLDAEVPVDFRVTRRVRAELPEVWQGRRS